jgi:hypothetical protein
MTYHKKTSCTIQSSWWRTKDVRNIYKTPRIELKHYFEKCTFRWFTLHKCTSHSYFTNSHSSSPEGKNTWSCSFKPPIRFHQLTVTNWTDQALSWETNRFSASPEIPLGILRNPNVHHRSHNSRLKTWCIKQQRNNFPALHNEVFELIHLSAYCYKCCLILKWV